jgi:hypothetical protein
VVGVALAALAFHAGLACAVNIPVGASAADDLIFNFDLPAVLPGAPYDEIQVTAHIDGFDPGEALYMDLFAELNGGGSILGSLNGLTCAPPCTGGVTVTFSSSIISPVPDFLDGVFSLGFHVSAGALQLTSVEGEATNHAGDSATVSGVAAAVPEPGMPGLLAVALGILALSRRRSRR